MPISALAIALATFIFIDLRISAADREQLIRATKTGTLTTGFGDVRYQPVGKDEKLAGYPSSLDFGDAVRTLRNARASVEFRDRSSLNMPDRSRLQIATPDRPTNGAMIRVLEGQVYYLHHGAPRSIPIETPHLAIVPTGTEFLVNVDLAANQTSIAMFDGEAEMTRGDEVKLVHRGELGVAAVGQPLRVGPIEATNIVQWWIYYPGVLDADDLRLSGETVAMLNASLTAYRQGDLRKALEKHPGLNTADARIGDDERTYHAALLLANGSVSEAFQELGSVTTNFPPARALRTAIAAVSTPIPSQESKAARSANFPLPSSDDKPTLATEWVAHSYRQQSQYDLAGALRSARQAVDRSPEFGFGWVRVAELEFSHGNNRRAREAVEKALRMSPLNAQAHAVHGFLLAGENRIADALAAFEEAIRLDPALANGWLGRGLCRIRGGNPEMGREDLRIASALEPRRSLVRSYSGKAFADGGEFRLARSEYEAASRLDPEDPTPPLYSALLSERMNRANDAVRELEHSMALNDNRRVYRSRLLLDQDRAVRGENLAMIYQDAGLSDVSVREAAHAVNTDYGNFSAHLFLANSYDELRDPRQVNLRFETPWLSEYLIANLLAPVGAGPLSPYVTQQEYSKLFERDRMGFASITEYSSRGDWLQTSSQFGTFGDTSYEASAFYRAERGDRPNSDLEQLTTSLKARQQLTPQDSLYLQAIYYESESGDVTQYYDQRSSNPGLRTKETQEPILLAGYHHEWRPGVHTLACKIHSGLVGRKFWRKISHDRWFECW